MPPKTWHQSTLQSTLSCGQLELSKSIPAHHTIGSAFVAPPLKWPTSCPSIVLSSSTIFQDNWIHSSLSQGCDVYGWCLNVQYMFTLNGRTSGSLETDNLQRRIRLGSGIFTPVFAAELGGGLQEVWKVAVDSLAVVVSGDFAASECAV